MKVKVIEVDALKLDPNAVHIIVFNSRELPFERMKYIDEQLKEMGVKFVGTFCDDPEKALKVFEIPKPIEKGSLDNG